LIPLPDEQARAQIMAKLLTQVKHSLSDRDLMKFAKTLEYYSASDIANLVKEAAMEPLRHYSCVQVAGLSKNEIRAVSVKDLENAKQAVLPSLTKKDVTFFVDWEKKYGGAG
jgi:SpoVK/Ycf46/Vps4 family AAA+-type ATPase